MDYVNYSIGILYNRLITLLLYQEANIVVCFQKGSQNSDLDTSATWARHVHWSEADNGITIMDYGWMIGGLAVVATEGRGLHSMNSEATGNNSNRR
jgi:hypothetical protein